MTLDPLDALRATYVDCQRVGFTSQALAAVSHALWGSTIPSSQWPAEQQRTMAELLSLTAQAGSTDPSWVARVNRHPDSAASQWIQGAMGHVDTADARWPQQITSLLRTLARSTTDATETVVGRIRNGDSVDDVPSATLQTIRDTLAARLDMRWATFVTTLDQCVAALDTLGQEPRSTFGPLAVEVVSLRRSVSLTYPRPSFDPQDSERLGCLVGIRDLSLSEESMTECENAALDQVLSPLEKVFDLGLALYMDAIEDHLKPLHLKWMAREPLVAFQPGYHTLLKPTKSPPRAIFLISPGLTRDGRVVLKAWGEPVIAIDGPARRAPRL